MKRLFLYGLLAAVMLLTASLEREQKTTSSAHADTIRIAIFKSEHGGYGYDIFVNEKMSIHQPHIPVIANTIGFSTKDDATKIAMVVVGKLKQNEMPPTVTRDELMELGIGN